MPKFVEGFADKLIVPAGARDIQVFDDELPGFGIRKFESGRASFFVKYSIGAQQRRKTLGKVVRGNLKAMRLEASAILAKARLGTDVVAVARAAAAKHSITLGEIVPRYLKARESELRPKSHFEATRYLERAWQPLHKLPIDAITRQNVVGIVDDLETNSGKVAADRARMALSGLFGWSIDRGYLDTNPTVNVRARAHGGGRTRVLSEPELVEVWNACLDDDYGRIVRLLILTGQRRSEIGDLGWCEIHPAKRQIELPEHRTKNGRPHIVPLSNEALELLEGASKKSGREFVFGVGAGGFGGWSKAKAELDARIANARKAACVKNAMPEWTLHDLRRSFEQRPVWPASTIWHSTPQKSGKLLSCWAHTSQLWSKAAQTTSHRRDICESWLAQDNHHARGQADGPKRGTSHPVSTRPSVSALRGANGRRFQTLSRNVHKLRRRLESGGTGKPY